MNRCSIPLIAVGVLAGCATARQPPLGADNPASPSAPEAIEHLLRNSLTAAGNINDLALAQQQTSYSRYRLDVATTEAEILRNREQLNRLLGLWGTGAARQRARSGAVQHRSSVRHVAWLDIRRL